MKKIFIGLILLLNSFYAATAQSDKVNEKYDLYIDIGLKYAFDISGIALGLSIYSPSKKLSLSFRQDFLASIGAKDYYIGLNDSSNLFIQTNKIDFVRYHTQNYFELAYIVHPKITTSLGYGWVFAGSKENVRFNRDYGYPILSLAVSYQPSWFSIELRGDIPTKDNNTRKIFPASLSLKYRFKPKQIIRPNKSS